MVFFCRRHKSAADEAIKESASSVRSLLHHKRSYSGGIAPTTRTRRQRIPDKPKTASMSMWGFLKNCIGKDLSQFPIPINFNEPLSLLQRLAEEMEYFELLDKAACCSSPYEQLAYLAVFIVSGYSSSSRSTKPFNPLLGETFEFDRMEDLGYRMICEQISHHPPIAAHHCEGNGWVLYQEFSFETKFTGNDIVVTPHGEANVEFSEGNSFKWNKILTTVHNFLVGTLWIDHQGLVEIIGNNQTEGIICHLDFIPYTGSSTKRIKSEIRKIRGTVLDANGIQQWKINGNCDDQVEIAAVLVHDTDNEIVLDKPRIAWKCNALPDGSANYYSFSTFACQLNEPEEGVAPTDSRRRPDQRLMEEGNFEEAGNEKNRLEQKQRNSMKGRSEHEVHIPIWFDRIRKDDGGWIHKYNGRYWKSKEVQNWSKCPDIF